MPAGEQRRPPDTQEPSEFVLFRDQALRSAAILCALVLLFGGVLWWSASTLHFGSDRAQGKPGGTFRVRGVIRDQTTGAPIPWGNVSDDPSGTPPIATTTADVKGAFELVTVAEPHALVVQALGYRPATIRMQQPWFLWQLKTTEEVEVRLEREP